MMLFCACGRDGLGNRAKAEGMPSAPAEGKAQALVARWFAATGFHEKSYKD